jgi:VWFA-related protein
MRRALAMVGLFAWVNLLSGQTATPVFRVAADAVAVNVSVKRGNLPVLGLTPGDFVLYDNDVRQRVAALSMDAVPLDVSLVVDTSASVSVVAETTRETVRQLTALLRPTDRFRALTMGSSVIQTVPWQPAGQPDTSRIQTVPGPTSLVTDSVLLALAHRADPERRHLVVALTDGEDVCSLASGDSLRRGAERSGAVLHWIDLRLKHASKKENDARARGVGATCKNLPNNPTDVGDFLADAVRLTGGSVHIAPSTSDIAAIAKSFDAILEDFRQSYILHYTPDGVPRAGWHRLRVELVKKGDKVRARPGYWGAGEITGVR